MDDVPLMCNRMMNTITLEAREVINLYYEVCLSLCLPAATSD